MVIKLPVKGTDLTILAKDIRKEQQAAKRAAQSALEHAIRCGELLIEAKAKVKHGQWLPWLKDACSISDRTARAYMALAQNAESLPKDMTVRQALTHMATPKAKPNTATQSMASKSATVADLDALEKAALDSLDHDTAPVVLDMTLGWIVEHNPKDEALDIVLSAFKRALGNAFPDHGPLRLVFLGADGEELSVEVVDSDSNAGPGH